MAISSDESKLVSIFIQTLLYGAYTVVFVLTIWVLVYRRSPCEPANKTMLFISLVMFTLATMHIAINYTRIIKAFVTHRNAPGGPAAFFNQLSEFTQIFGSTVYIAQTLVGDGVVLYRCYLVCGCRRRFVAVPFLLLLASTACGIGILYSFAKVVPEAEIFVNELQNWIVSFFSLTLATNVICTGIVCVRLWILNQQILSFASHSYKPIIFMVVESGAVYSVTLIALLILYKAGSWFQYVLLDAISPIVGLVFSMIIVRIGLGITSIGGRTLASSNDESTSSRNLSSQSNTFGRVRLQFSRQPMTTNHEESIELCDQEDHSDASKSQIKDISIATALATE